MSSVAVVTRALLLADLVDGTTLWERKGRAGSDDASAAHDTVARGLLAPHGGREIDRTDGFLLLFDDVEAAVAYAFAYHAALRELGLRARVGLHVGQVALRENRASDVSLGAKPLEVEGLAKPVAARVMSVASAGQTLLTAVAAAAWSAPAASSAVVVSHGFWELRGVAEPVELFEVGVPGSAPLSPPPDTEKVRRVVRSGDAWLRARDIPNSLPRERDEFLGRDAELFQLARSFECGTTLVSVLGVDGAGKTRLATRYGWTRLGAWPGGVWFCDLSDASDPEGICRTAARALDVVSGGVDPVLELGNAIAARGRTLVILDDFEHARPHAAATLGRWMDLAPEARFVVTARDALGMRGEVALRVGPLATDVAAALFAARAAAARRGFALEEADRPVVAELVRVLGGTPRAIERAAARVRFMPPKSILERSRAE